MQMSEKKIFFFQNFHKFIEKCSLVREQPLTAKAIAEKTKKVAIFILLKNKL